MRPISKYHRQNHHTYTSDTNPDAGHDPIASYDNPFRGDFVLTGALSAIVPPTSAYAAVFLGSNVGVGTGSPNQLLTVAGNVSASGDLNVDGDLALQGSFLTNSDLRANKNLFVTNNIYGLGSLSVTQGASISRALTVIATASAYTSSFMGANVGIATIVPKYPLHVNGSSWTQGNAYVTGNLFLSGGVISSTTEMISSRGLDIVNYSGSTTTLMLRQSGYQPMFVAMAQAATAFYIDGDITGGFVGIGCTAPNANLTVNGNISSNSTIWTTILSANGINLVNGQANDFKSPSIFIGENLNNSISGFNIKYDELVDKLAVTTVFGTTPSISSIVITNTSNIGINTPNPNAVLTINGDISANNRIIAGYNNSASNCSSVLGGCNNNAAGTNSFIGGGVTNLSNGTHSVVLGGCINCSPGDSSSVTGGKLNCATGNFSHIGGGCSNVSSGCYAALGGGFDSTASGNYSFVGSGYQNTASGKNTSVVGGKANTASACYSFIAGGNSNVSAYCNTFILGSNLTASRNDYTYVNNISSQGAVCGTYYGDGSLLTGIHALGSPYTTGSTLSSIKPFDGCNCVTAAGCFSSIGGGHCNCISQTHSTISGGYNNKISNACSNIGGGRTNCITSTYSFIGGGISNKADGANNLITGGSSNVIVGGSSNCATTNASNSIIGSGYQNTVDAAYTAIGGGTNNCTGCTSSFVGGGSINCAMGYASTVVAGCQNTAVRDYTGILGGCNNTANHQNTFILGSNLTTAQANYTYVNNLSSQGNIVARTLTVNKDINVVGFVKNRPRKAMVSGTVRSIFVKTPGSGYGTAPNVYISAPTDTTDTEQATAYAIIQNGKVVNIVINNPGRGYLEDPTINIVGGGGGGAAAYAIATIGGHAHHTGRQSHATGILGEASSQTDQTRLYVAGFNYYGSLPTGYYGISYNSSPVSVAISDSDLNVNEIVKYWMAGDRMYVLDSTGTLWATGINVHGEAGSGTVGVHQTSFQKIYFAGGFPVVRFSCSGDGDRQNLVSCIAMTSNGQIWTWGYNGWGQLGTGDTYDYGTPTVVSSLGYNNIDVYMNSTQWVSTSFVLKADGTVQSCGYNGYGQTGRGDKIAKYTFGPVLKSALVSLTNVKEIHGNNGGYGASGQTYFLCNDNTLWGCGSNAYGFLGLNDYYGPDRVFATQITWAGPTIKKFRTTTVSGGWSSSYAYTGDKIYSWGWNNYGQLGTGDTMNRAAAALVYTPGIYTGGSSVTNVTNALNFSFSEIKDLIAKPYSFAMLTNDGRVFASGYNGYGQIGQSTNFSYYGRPLYVRTPNDDTASIAFYGSSIYLTLSIITREGRVYNCGYNGHGEVGIGDTSNQYFSPVEVYRF
jgi:hypothetical protein